jgi:hypothetical protein
MWLLEDFIDKHGHEPIYLELMEREVSSTTSAFATAIAHVVLDDGPDLDAFIHYRVRRQLGLDPF